MTTGTISARLAEVGLLLTDCSAIESVCSALESHLLQPHSTAAVRGAIAGGNATVEGHIRTLQDVWQLAMPTLSASGLALVLRVTAASAGVLRSQSLPVQVVWTGPRVEGSFLRATREVIRELLRAAHREVLVVGYWIAAREDAEGIIEEVIRLLAEAVERGVDVKLIVDERVRSDGRDNRQAFLSCWPASVALPTMLTWRLPADDHHLKLHAKVLVTDREEALVTSANLTFYAMDKNMEVGVRVSGRPARDIARHFDLLASSGVLELYGT